MNTYLHKQICLLIYNVNFLLMHIQNRQTTQSKKGCVFQKNSLRLTISFWRVFVVGFKNKNTRDIIGYKYLENISFISC